MYVIQDGRYRYANPKLAEILGYTQAELVGSDVADAGASTTTARPCSGASARAWTATMRVPYTFQAIRKNGELIDVEVHETAIELDGRPAIIGSLLDVTERKPGRGPGRRARLRRPADAACPTACGSWSGSRRTSPSRAGTSASSPSCYLDIDFFKFVNDNWGHNVGDRLLQSLALRLTRGVREVDTIARIGGDEFVVLVPDLRQSEDLSRFAQKLLAPRQPSGRHRRAHAPDHGLRRHRHVSGRRRGRRDAAAQRGRGDVPRQGPRRQQLRALHARADGDGRRAARAPERPAPGARARRAPAALPAARQHRRRAGWWASRRSCAGSIRRRAVLPPVTFIPVAEETGPHPAARRVGAARRRRASSRPGTRPARPADLGQLLGAAVPRTRSRPHRRASALRRPASSPSTSRSRSPSRSRWRARRSSSPT